jgi:hypothetical protein
MNEEVQAYIEALDPARRSLFGRVHQLVLETHPEAEVGLAYNMPVYRVGSRRLSLGAWKHGVSVYGFRKDNDGGFVPRHPKLASGRGTIRIGFRDADEISDDELRGLVGGALEP